MLCKYFLALVPPEPLLTDIWEIKQSIATQFNSKGALSSPAHITLHMPFLFEEEKEQKLFTCLEEFRFKSAFSVNLSDYDCFEPRVVFINVTPGNELFDLQKQLVIHVKRNLGLLNQANDLRGFHPHITIAFRDLKKSTFIRVWDEFKTKEFNADFTCDRISLLKQDSKIWKVYKEYFFK